jgi:hypothetical protein
VNAKIVKFTKAVDKLPDDLGLFGLANKIRDTQYAIYGKTSRTAKTLYESRFSSLDYIFKHGLKSCGSMSSVLGYALKRHGYLVKYVHGKVVRAPDSHRHAWLKVFDKEKKKWVFLDATMKSFKVLGRARKKKIYNDWKELKADYLKGDY